MNNYDNTMPSDQDDTVVTHTVVTTTSINIENTTTASTVNCDKD